MLFRILVRLPFLLLFCLLQLASAQVPFFYASNPRPDTIDTIRKTVDEVQVHFTVTDKKRRLLNELQRDQIAVFDRGQEVTPILDFRQDTDLPLRVLVLIDTSGSVDRYFGAQRQIAARFAGRLLRPGFDSASVATFSASLGPLVPLAPNMEADAFPPPSQGNLTGLYDALMQSLPYLTNRESGPARRILVLLSDGEDTYSLHTLTETIEALQRGDTSVYAVCVRRSRFGGGEVMLRLAEQTGGRMFAASKPERLEQVFAEIEAELRSQYMVSFHPSQHDGSFHPLRVTVSGAGDVRVIARSGYWSPKD